MPEVAVVTMGLFAGSFVNATAWRLQSTLAGERPWMEMWLGRSACTRCGHRLAARDLVPLLSWLVLLGRCRYCRQPISVRYPISELLAAAVFMVVFLAW